MKQLLIVGAGYMGRQYLSAARSLGLRVRLVETDSWVAEPAPNLELHRITGRGQDAWSVDEIWALGGYAAAAAGDIAGVLAFAEPHVVAAALVADRLGLPGPSLQASILSRNKALQRACFAAHRMPQPEFTHVVGVEDAVSWSAAKLPVIVKPFSLSASRGVEQFTDVELLRSALHARQGERLLVESAVTGPEYSWEGFVRDGEVLFGNLTAKETTGPPYFIEVEHRAGYRFDDPVVRRAVDSLTRDVVRCIGLRTGIVHLEFRVHDQGLAIMEFAVRTPGDFIFDLLATTYEFDPYRAAVQLSMNLEPDLPVSDEARSYATVWFPVCEPGEITHVTGFDAIEAHPNVTRAALSAKPGDRLSSIQRVGYVMITAGTPQERDDALAFTKEALTIRTIQ